MLPILHYTAALKLFVQVINLLRWTRYKYDDFEIDFYLISMYSSWIRIILNMLIMYVQSLKWLKFKSVRKKKNLMKPHKVLKLLRNYRATLEDNDVWMNMNTNWNHFFWLTGETPETLQILVNVLNRKYFLHRQYGRRYSLDLRNQVLLAFIWLRKYPTLFELSHIFGVTVSSLHRNLHRILPFLHSYLVPKYIKWHSMNKWRSLIGTFPDWPRVVAIVDCTPFRINKPKGGMQRLFYRKDRHCCFLNWLVITDVTGQIVYSRPGWFGHLNDQTIYRHITLPVIPMGLHIMADQGFPRIPPLLITTRNNRNNLPARIRWSFRKRRSDIERCFRTLKFSYKAAGTSRFRSRRWYGPLICNIVASLFNRRRIIFSGLRRALSVN